MSAAILQKYAQGLNFNPGNDLANSINFNICKVKSATHQNINSFASSIKVFNLLNAA